MTEYNPDGWVLIKVQLEDGEYLYKVFGSWRGSYTSGDAWRLNSGITKYSVEDHTIHFYGSSGSVYSCGIYHENDLSFYTGAVLDNLLDNSKGLAQTITFEEFVKEFDV